MVRRAILLGCMLAPVAVIAWIVLHGQSPSLGAKKAASIISSTLEFKQTGSLVNVSDLSRVNDSMGERYYVEFTFVENRSMTRVKAQGEFGYWSGSWHLREFHYGERQNMKIVEIKSDMPPESEFTR